MTTMSASIGAERGWGRNAKLPTSQSSGGSFLPPLAACRGENKCRLITISPTEYHRYQYTIGAIIQRYCYYEALTLCPEADIQFHQVQRTPRKVENESYERGLCGVRRKIRSRLRNAPTEWNGPKCAQQIELQYGIFNAAPGRWRRSRGLLPTVASPL